MENSMQIVHNLYEKYKNDEKIINKINVFIEQLPKTIENTDTNLQFKQLRKDKLTSESEIFINSFLNQKNIEYFYITNTNTFIKYNNQHYEICKEDDLQYHILSSLSKNKQLASWKHKIKVRILKLIKERTIFKTIPDSFTIQFVLSKFLKVFNNKNEIKYFLTILGDNILKKSDNINHIVSPSLKTLLKEISHNCNIYFETIRSPDDSFKYKYHDHDYKLCRLIDLHNEAEIPSLTIELSKNNYLIDVICVAVHYSVRFDTSDNFLNNFCDDSRLVNHVSYLKNNTSEEIVAKFIENNFRILERKTKSFDWKIVLFLWKQYLEFNKLPNIIFQSNLKNMLIQKLKYDENADKFLNVTNKYFTFIEEFFSFWKENITTDFDQEYEIDELTQIFKNHYQKNKTTVTKKNIYKIINYFYPNIEISDDNNVMNISCSLWNKNSELDVFLSFFKNKINFEISVYKISFYDMYTEYCKQCSSSYNYIVSKKYFDKYIIDNVNEQFIVDDSFILSSWWNN